METPLQRLTKAIHFGDTVIVTGAGVSAAIGSNEKASSWVKLLQSGIDQVSARHPQRGALLALRLEQADDASDFGDIAESIRRDLGEDFPRWISLATAGEPVSDALAQLIAALGLPMLTTNYDTLLDDALKRASATWLQPDEMRKILQGSSDAIGHLHGARTDPESIILSTSDYSRILEDRRARSIQDSAFNLKTFIFIGAGSTTDDPNFGMMLRSFSSVYNDSEAVHFRLCRDSESDAASETKSVVDVPYGDGHEDLLPFLQRIVEELQREDEPRHRRNALNTIAQTVQETSLVVREHESSAAVPLANLVVDPILLPVSHAKFASFSPIRNRADRERPLEVDEVIREGKVLLVAGESNSGISTTVAWLASKAAMKLSAYPLTIPNPLKVGKNPIVREVNRSHRDRGIAPEKSRDILCIDNFRFEDSRKFNNAFDDICRSRATMSIIGVSESDAFELSSKFKAAGFEDTQVAFLGRFGEQQTIELANLIAPGEGQHLAKQALAVAVDKHLPRTPFTLTLLIELLRTGVHPGEGDTETWLLGKYIDFLLEKELYDDVPYSSLTIRNKRAVLEAIAKMLVSTLSDEAPIESFEDCANDRVKQLGWDSNGRAIIADFLKRRVLAYSPRGKVRFVRSSYLELMAGEAASRDGEFRSHILSNPIQLSSICCAFVAVSRNDREALEVVSRELQRIQIGPPKGGAFGKIKKVLAQEDLDFDEIESDGGSTVGQNGESAAEYLGEMSLLPPDSDPPAYLMQSFEKLSPARQSMIIVDLVSRVLRDSDEVEDQNFKAEVAGKLLLSWFQFIDLFEKELESLPLDQPENDSDLSEEEFYRAKLQVLRTTPLFTALGGLSSCLTSPRMRILLDRAVDPDLNADLQSYALLVRVLALWALDGEDWIAALTELPDAALRTFCGAVFLQGLARGAYIEDHDLDDRSLEQILSYIRRCADAQFDYRNRAHRSSVFNKIESGLRSSRMSSRLRSQAQA